MNVELWVFVNYYWLRMIDNYLLMWPVKICLIMEAMDEKASHGKHL